MKRRENEKKNTKNNENSMECDVDNIHALNWNKRITDIELEIET